MDLDATGTYPAEQPSIPTILLVDDNPAILEWISRALSRHGYDVLIAPNGSMALTLAAHCAKRVRLLLTDVEMPGMDGVVLARKFCTEFPETRIMFMSGAVQPAAIEGSSFLCKPFTLRALLDAVKELLAQNGSRAQKLAAAE
jgi:DNA-binding response OmpR family regulator